LPEISRGPQGRCRARRRVRGTPERWADGAAAQTVFNDGGVAPVVVDECGGSCSSRETRG
jgi:hypothetical protein